MALFSWGSERTERLTPEARAAQEVDATPIYAKKMALFGTIGLAAGLATTAVMGLSLAGTAIGAGGTVIGGTMAGGWLSSTIGAALAGVGFGTGTVQAATGALWTGVKVAAVAIPVGGTLAGAAVGAYLAEHSVANKMERLVAQYAREDAHNRRAAARAERSRGPSREGQELHAANDRQRSEMGLSGVPDYFSPGDGLPPVDPAGRSRNS